MTTAEDFSADQFGGYAPLRLSNDHLDVTILPEKGCDIVRVRDRRTGIDVMSRTPWGFRPVAPVPPLMSSADVWLHRYGGGWQVLFPNGGEECVVDGSTFGFHGEAAVVPWRVETADATHARLHVEFFTVPVAMQRSISVDGAVLRVEETVTNLGPDPVNVMWSHHPTFGPPLVEAGASVQVSADAYWNDPVSPGSQGVAGARDAWPHVSGAGGLVDLSVMPPPDESRHSFGYLLGVQGATARIVNPVRDLGVTLRWDGELMPHAWCWQELRSSPGHPWHRRAEIIAIEPAACVPGHGLTSLADYGEQPLGLEPGSSRTFWIELELGSLAAEERR